MADRIVGEYSIKVDEAVKNLDKLAGRVGKLEDASKKAAKNTESEYSKMTSNLMGQFKNLAGAIGIAFSVQQVVALGREMVTLAAQAEGVERAFKRVGSPQLLADLRKATRGTVSDLQLMQNAVKASNFKIPLENLAALFKFAQARARETGESVDYLVDSIILGIGRKSPLILDNLGISAVELRERLKGVGVEASSVGDIAQIIGDIATEELEKMGNQADTTADKIAKITASFENFKVEAGKELISTFGELNTEVEKTLTLFDVEGVDAFGVALRGLKHVLDDLTAPFRLLNNTLQWVGERYQQLKEFFGGEETEEERMAIERLQKAFEDMRKSIDENVKTESVATGQTVVYVRSMNQLNKELKDLNDEFGKAEIGGELWYSLIDRIEKKTRELKDATTLASAAINGSGFAELADADVIPLIDDKNLPAVKQQLDVLGMSLEEAFGTDGTERIQMFWDDFLRSSLEALDKTGNKLDESLNLFNDYASAVSEIYQGIQSVISATYQREYDDLQRQLDNGLISREQYEEELNTIRRREAASNKDAAIFNAVISTAQAVVNALGAFPFSPSNIALAAAIGAAGAAQIAAIASQPLPQFAEGGFVDQHGEIKGRKHKYGGVVIEAEGGEFITSAKYARPNAEILKAINSGDWEKYKVDNIIAPAIEQVLKGGFGGMSASYELNSMFNDKNILKVLDRNRQAERDSANYIVKGITKGLSRRQSRWN